MKKKSSGFGKIKIVVLLGVLIYAGVTFVNQQSSLATQLEREKALAQQEAELQREIDFRRNELNYIGTDDYIEQQARIRLGWLKPDEIKYVEDASGNVVPEATAAESTDDTETSAPDAQNSEDVSAIE